MRPSVMSASPGSTTCTRRASPVAASANSTTEPTATTPAGTPPAGTTSARSASSISRRATSGLRRVVTPASATSLAWSSADISSGGRRAPASVHCSRASSVFALGPRPGRSAGYGPVPARRHGTRNAPAAWRLSGPQARAVVHREEAQGEAPSVASHRLHPLPGGGTEQCGADRLRDGQGGPVLRIVLGHYQDAGVSARHPPRRRRLGHPAPRPRAVRRSGAPRGNSRACRRAPGRQGRPDHARGGPTPSGGSSRGRPPPARRRGPVRAGRRQRCRTRLEGAECPKAAPRIGRGQGRLRPSGQAGVPPEQRGSTLAVVSGNVVPGSGRAPSAPPPARGYMPAIRLPAWAKRRRKVALIHNMEVRLPVGQD